MVRSDLTSSSVSQSTSIKAPGSRGAAKEKKPLARIGEQENTVIAESRKKRRGLEPSREGMRGYHRRL